MRTEEMNQGEKIPYIINENEKSIIFDEQVTVNLEDEQESSEKVVDIGLDRNSDLIKGKGKWYVANLVIPGEKFKLVDTGEVDEEGNKVLKKVKKELNLDDVELALWSLPDSYNNKNIGGVE